MSRLRSACDLRGRSFPRVSGDEPLSDANRVSSM